MRWRVVFASLALTGCVMLQAGVLPEPGARAQDWRSVVLQQALNITPEDFATLRSKVLANRFVKAANPETELRDKPAAEAVAALRERLRLPDAGSSIHLALGDRLWEHYLRTGDMAAGQEAVKWWERWTEAVAEPTRPLHMARRLAELGLWEAAVPMLRRAAGRCPPESVGQLRSVASLFRKFQLEVEAEFAAELVVLGDQETLMRAVVAWELGAKELARLLLAKVRRLPANYRAIELRLQAETLGVENDVMALRALIVAAGQTTPADPAWEADAARALARALDKQRAALVDGSVAQLRKGSAFASDFDYALAAACAAMENRPRDAAFFASEHAQRSKGRPESGASLSFILAEEAAEHADAPAWSAALKSLPSSAASDFVDATIAAVLRDGSREKLQLFCDSVADDVKRALAEKTPANLGRLGAWCLLAGRNDEAGKVFQEALGKASRLDDRLALAYGLAVARQQNGDEDAALRTFDGLPQDRMNALLLTLLVESSSPAKPDMIHEENLLPKAFQLAGAENREEQARRAANWLKVDLRWRALEDMGESFPPFGEQANIASTVEIARHAWPVLRLPVLQGYLTFALRDHLAELEPLFRDMVEQRAQTVRALHVKFGLAFELKSSMPGKQSPATVLGRRLLWSVFDDAWALEAVRQKEVESHKEPLKAGSLASGIWRHRFGEWEEIKSHGRGWLTRERKTAWATPLDELAKSPAPDIDIPKSSLRSLQGQVLPEIRARMDRDDANPAEDFRRELIQRLDAANANYEERLTTLIVADCGREAFTLAQDHFNDDRLTLEQAADSLIVLCVTTGFSWSMDRSDSKRVTDLKVALSGWLLERADQWPEKKKIQWRDLVKSHLPGNGPRSPEYRQLLSKLSPAPGAAEASARPADPVEGLLFDLKTPKNRLVALDQLEGASRNGRQFSAEQCKTLSDFALNWLLGNSMMALSFSRMPAGFRPPVNEAAPDPDAAARALVLCSAALSKQEWQAESDSKSGGVGSWFAGENNGLPTEADALPVTRFLPPHFLLTAARTENVSPLGLVDSTQMAYAHEWRYQTVVRWLEAQARARKSPDDIPFRLLSLQLRWSGGERREAALRAKDWFGLSPYPDLRFVACDLLQRTNYDREAVTLAFGLLGAGASPPDRVMGVLTQSLSKLPVEEREASIGKLAEQDGMKALLTSAAVVRATVARTNPAPTDPELNNYRRDPFSMPGSSNDVAKERRFLEQLRYDGRQASAMLVEALSEARSLGPLEFGGGATPGEQRLMRWARQLQTAHWLEAAGRLCGAPRQTGGIANPGPTIEHRRSMPAGPPSAPMAKGLFFDLLRAIEPAGSNPVWQIHILAATLNPPFWFRVARLENQAGDAVFRFDVSEDGNAWQEIETVHWPHLGEIVSLGIANLSDAPLPYEHWKFGGFKKPDPNFWTWSKGETTAGRLPVCRYQRPKEPLPESGALSKSAGGNLQEIGDTFSGLTRQVLGSGTMTIKLEAPPPGGRVGVFVQKDWFAGGARIMVTVDAAGKLEVSQRLGQTDALSTWKALASKEAATGSSVWCLNHHLQALIDLHHDDEAWHSIAELPDKDLLRLLTGGCAGVLATVHASRSGMAPIFADRLLELGRLQPDDPKIRAGMAAALRILTTALPAVTEQDRARRDATDSFLANYVPPISPTRRFSTGPMGYPLPEVSPSPTHDASPAQPRSPRNALEELAAVSRKNVPQTPARDPASAFGLSLLDISYHPETGLTFRLVQKALVLRGQPEAAKALEIFPLGTAPGDGPMPDAVPREGVSSGPVAMNQGIRSQMGLGLHLALGDAEAARTLPESLAAIRRVPFGSFGMPSTVFRQVIASCLHAGGFENEAVGMLHGLLTELTGPFPRCWDYSFDVPLRLAIWSKDNSVRGEALDQFVELVRRQKRAAPYDAMFRLAIRRGAELLRNDHRSGEAKELEEMAGAEF